MKPLKIHQMNWEKLRWFYLITHYSSISKAARHLNITPSALGRNLADLEMRLNLKLFERRPQGIVLLPEGQELLNVLSPFFQNLMRYDEHRGSQQDKIQGQLRLLISSHLPVSYLIQQTPHFLEQHPDLEFSLVHPQDAKESLTQQADCSIQEYKTGQEDDRVQEPLVTLSYGLYAAQHYLDQHEPLERIEDIETHAKILLKTAVMPAWGWPKAVPYDGEKSNTHIFSTAQDVLWATQQGLGIAALPRRQAANYSDLVALPFYIEDPKVDLYYSYPTYYQNFKRVTLYGQFLTEALKRETSVKNIPLQPSSDLRGIDRRPVLAF